MEQVVTNKTRKEATLDWVLTNTQEYIKDITVSKQEIGDHHPVAFTVNLGTVSLDKQNRVLWYFPRAKWKHMKQ